MENQNTMKISILFCFLVFFIGFTNAWKNPNKIRIYELKSGNMTVKFSNWGASIISLVVPDKNGKLDDIVLGYDSVKDYMNDTLYMGATIGRVANRIGGAKFLLNGTHYKLNANDGKSTLNGGSRGFSDVIWKVLSHEPSGPQPFIKFGHRSYNGDQGFPGEVGVTVTYRILIGNSNMLSVFTVAKGHTKPSPINIAQNTYWNLGGHNSGSILSNKVQIFGSNYIPLDRHLIPTGKVAPVKGTPYDFLKPRKIRNKMHKFPIGYDMNYVLDSKQNGTIRTGQRAAEVYDKESGRGMLLITNAPVVQFNTGSNLAHVRGKGGFIYKANAGFSLVTQGYPDAVNHPNFPAQIVGHGFKSYNHNSLFAFYAKP